MSKTGTFLVTAADETSAVLRDVDAGQVHALASNPDVAVGDVLDATIEPEPPLEVTWRVASVESRRAVAVSVAEEPPAESARAAATDLGPGEATTLDAPAGETHVLAVGEGAADAAAEVAADDATRVHAARLGADRVTVRHGEGVVSVRYRLSGK